VSRAASGARCASAACISEINAIIDWEGAGCRPRNADERGRFHPSTGASVQKRSRRQSGDLSTTWRKACAALGACAALLAATPAAASPPPPPPRAGPPPPAPPLAEPPVVYAPAPTIVLAPPPPPPLPIAMRVAYAPFYAAGLVLRYGVYYAIVAPLEVLGRALSYGVAGGVSVDSDEPAGGPQQ
jgi:hypothetical protein